MVYNESSQVYHASTWLKYCKPSSMKCWLKPLSYSYTDRKKIQWIFVHGVEWMSYCTVQNIIVMSKTFTLPPQQIFIEFSILMLFLTVYCTVYSVNWMTATPCESLIYSTFTVHTTLHKKPYSMKLYIFWPTMSTV